MSHTTRFSVLLCHRQPASLHSWKKSLLRDLLISANCYWGDIHPLRLASGYLGLERVHIWYPRRFFGSSDSPLVRKSPWANSYCLSTPPCMSRNKCPKRWVRRICCYPNTKLISTKASEADFSMIMKGSMLNEWEILDSWYGLLWKLGIWKRLVANEL